ncbi:MAG: Fimbrial assembly protein (PilN) [Firmicutes bacterium]|nr:Fimbrial assembly protein (PilN) [Bacillota bacterium]
MVRINLLPLDEQRPDIPYARVAIFFVAVFMVLAGCIYVAEELSLMMLRSEQATVQARYEELVLVRQAMETAGGKQKRIDAKQMLVKSVEKSRNGLYNLLPRVAVLFTDKVWLNETRVNKENSHLITLLGEAVDYTELAALVSRLEADPLFSSVLLKSTEGDTKTGTLKFVVDLKLKEM